MPWLSQTRERPSLYPGKSWDPLSTSFLFPHFRNANIYHPHFAEKICAKITLSARWISNRCTPRKKQPTRETRPRAKIHTCSALRNIALMLACVYVWNARARVAPGRRRRRSKTISRVRSFSPPIERGNLIRLTRASFVLVFVVGFPCGGGALGFIGC